MTTNNIENLKSTLRGKLVQAGDPDYDESRNIYNAMIDREPQYIVYCENAAMHAIRHLTVVALCIGVTLALAGCSDGNGVTGPESPADGATGTVWAQITAGSSSTCGVTAAGNGYCWGRSTYGKLGTGSEMSRNRPTSVVGGRTFTSISVGHNHACGITETGAAYCWGRNRWGVLGDGTQDDSSEPVAVAGGHTFAAIAAASTDTYGVTTDGALLRWGHFYDSHVPVTVPGGRIFAPVITSVSGHACALTVDGSAYCWGFNTHGSLGNGKPDDDVRIIEPTAVVGGHRFRTISAGVFYTCGVTTADEVYCWGDYAHSTVGIGSHPPSPEPVAFPTDYAVETVSAGTVHTCTLDNEGTARCWGNNVTGALGDGTSDSRPSPVEVAGEHKFRSLSAGSHHTCGITTDGAGYCWGRDYNGGALGSGRTRDRSFVPVRVVEPN